MSTGSVPCPYEGRAWWGETLVARSTACRRLDRPGRAPELYFPRDDIRFEHFLEGRPHRHPAGDEARWWGTDGADDVLWTLTGTSGAPPDVAGWGAFDADRVRVELFDPVAGEDPRAATVTRFPTWGDAADLIDVLDVRPSGSGFAGKARADERRPVVEGSQMLAQAVVAATRRSPGRRAVSADMAFLRAADARQTLDVHLDELSAGRTFWAAAVRVNQAGRCCAAGTLLLDVTAPDLISHADRAPDVPGPLDCPPHDMGVTGRDLRVVDDAYTGDPGAPVGPPELDCWVRFRTVPDDQALHAGLLAQFTGHLPIAAAMRPHAGVGQSQAHRSLSTAVTAIHLSIHAEVRADRWLLYHHRSTFAGAGMTHAECRVYDEERSLVASFSVEAMVRAFAGSGRAPADDRTAL